MSVGNNFTSDTVNQQITGLSLRMRDLMQDVANLSSNINGQGTGLAVLEAIGYDSDDATTAQGAISYLNTMAEVYFVDAAQTPPFNFDQELSQYWAGG
jgi:hypothetical protein